MPVKRKNYTAQEKAKIALDAIKGNQTIAQLTSKYSVHASQITTWKKQLLAALPNAFSDKRKRENKDQQQLVEQLYQQIGQLTIEIDWLKKKSELFSDN